jgi:hypothetical protein
MEFVFWKALKISLGQVEMQDKIFDKETLEVFLHPPHPLARESFIRIVESTIPKLTTLSIQKRACEKYLLRNTA